LVYYEGISMSQIVTKSIRQTVQATRNHAHSPQHRSLPLPNGWFAVCFSGELKPATRHTVSFMGEELVLYRTASGIARVIEPYCPHLGAHLGHDSTIDGEHLVCPFHHFRYDPDGYCSSHGPQTGQRRIRLSMRETRELNGLLYVWHDSEGRPPSWELPQLDLSHYSAPRETLLAIRGHVQDFAENTVDLAHTTCVHGLGDPRLAPPQFDRHCMQVHLHAMWRNVPFKMHLDIHGLGYTHLTSELPSLGATITALVTPTPVNADTWIIRHVQRLRIPGFARIPGPLRNALYSPLTLYIDHWLKSQLCRDIRIWDHRRYNERPRLTPEDGPILRFRQWSAQFYPSDQAGHGEWLRQAELAQQGPKASPDALYVPDS
jgi:nitrite reductase/ring-hydroxylating ferredoxin subunit